MTLKESQDIVIAWNEERSWMQGDVKDLLMNMVEESGEAWNIIKWVGKEKQPELLQKHHDHFEDFIGDQLFLIFKIAGFANVDAQKAFERTMKDYDERFPIEKVKGQHANIHAGGHDGKYTN